MSDPSLTGRSFGLRRRKQSTLVWPESIYRVHSVHSSSGAEASIRHISKWLTARQMMPEITLSTLWQAEFPYCSSSHKTRQVKMRSCSGLTVDTWGIFATTIHPPYSTLCILWWNKQKEWLWTNLERIHSLSAQLAPPFTEASLHSACAIGVADHLHPMGF